MISEEYYTNSVPHLQNYFHCRQKIFLNYPIPGDTKLFPTIPDISKWCTYLKYIICPMGVVQNYLNIRGVSPKTDLQTQPDREVW